jgi:hypothetical protein
MQGTHVVVKAFGGPDKSRYEPGQVVDAAAWPNARALVASRYIRERTVQDAAKDQPQTRPIRGKG